MFKRTIAVDFDGVIHGYSKGWADGSIYDPPIEGARQSLHRIRRAGYRVLIFSTRCSDREINGEVQKGQFDEVRAYLDKHKIPYDGIWTDEKPIYSVLIDDNAIRFPPRGFWPWLRRLFRVSTPWFECEAEMERLGILKPGEGEEP